MNTLTLITRNNQIAFAPCDEITGEIGWELKTRPSSVELRLFWYTRGKGTTDAGIADALHIDAPPQGDRRAFRLRFPDAPYSFSGTLISVIWALELVAEPGHITQRLDLVMAPSRQEILLSRA